jgi:hypothetical protein
MFVCDDATREEQEVSADHLTTSSLNIATSRDVSSFKCPRELNSN